MLLAITTHKDEVDFPCRALSTLLAQTHNLNGRFIVIYGNETTEKSESSLTDLLSQKNGRSLYIRVPNQTQNGGLSGTWNDAGRLALALKSKLLVPLNHDVEVKPGFADFLQWQVSSDIDIAFPTRRYPRKGPTTIVTPDKVEAEGGHGTGYAFGVSGKFLQSISLTTRYGPRQWWDQVRFPFGWNDFEFLDRVDKERPETTYGFYGNTEANVIEHQDHKSYVDNDFSWIVRSQHLKEYEHSFRITQSLSPFGSKQTAFIFLQDVRSPANASGLAELLRLTSNAGPLRAVFVWGYGGWNAETLHTYDSVMQDECTRVNPFASGSMLRILDGNCKSEITAANLSLRLANQYGCNRAIIVRALHADAKAMFELAKNENASQSPNKGLLLSCPNAKEKDAISSTIQSLASYTASSQLPKDNPIVHFEGISEEEKNILVPQPEVPKVQAAQNKQANSNSNSSWPPLFWVWIAVVAAAAMACFGALALAPQQPSIINQKKRVAAS